MLAKKTSKGDALRRTKALVSNHPPRALCLPHFMRVRAEECDEKDLVLLKENQTVFSKIPPKSVTI
jgi:hypothetical protein